MELGEKKRPKQFTAHEILIFHKGRVFWLYGGEISNVLGN
jgi:hypothetical protein